MNRRENEGMLLVGEKVRSLRVRQSVGLNTCSVGSQRAVDSGWWNPLCVKAGVVSEGRGYEKRELSGCWSRGALKMPL